MRFRVYVKEDGDDRFKPVRTFETLKDAARFIEDDEEGNPHKIWDCKAEGWVDPHMVLWACITCRGPKRKRESWRG